MRTPPVSGQPYGHLSFAAKGATGLVACSEGGEQGPYKVYANIKGGRDFSECLGFDAFALPYEGKTAWQYT